MNRDRTIIAVAVITAITIVLSVLIATTPRHSSCLDAPKADEICEPAARIYEQGKTDGFNECIEENNLYDRYEEDYGNR